MPLRDLSLNLKGDVVLYFDEGNDALVTIDPAVAAQVVALALQAYMQVLAPGVELEALSGPPRAISGAVAKPAPPLSPREVLANLPAPMPREEVIAVVEAEILKLSRANLISKYHMTWEGEDLVVNLFSIGGEPTGAKLQPRHMNEAGLKGFKDFLYEIATSHPDRLMEDDL